MDGDKGTLDSSIYQAILACMGEGIIFVDKDDRLAYINAAAEKIRNIRAENYLGLNLSSIHSPQTAERVRELLAGMKRGAMPSCTKTIEVKEKIFENCYYPIRDNSGNYVGTLLVSRDITEKELLKEENLGLREQVHSELGFGDMIGKSPAMQPVFKVIHAAAAVDSTILITGESGTGKELVALAIHEHSRRKNHPMIKVNCAALPETLLESELFGYEKGAFTGAVKERKGKFEQAQGGSIFLDEIAEMPIAAQSKLLRVLQERTVERLGGNKEIKVDVRIIAATNKDLRHEVDTRKFREDLYYRLNVIPIHLPPLRERREDIQPLAQQFLNRFAEKMHKPVLEIAANANNALMEYAYPGNIRELENTIERAVALSIGGELRLEDLPLDFSRPLPAPSPSTPPPSVAGSLATTVHRFERSAIEEALRATGNRKGEAAKLLGISRKTLWEKMKLLQIT